MDETKPTGPNGVSETPSGQLDHVSTAELAAAVRRLSRASVLVVGDAMLDRYVYGTVERISREAPVPVLEVQHELAVPGGAANVVRNLGALGAAVAFVSVVGDDQAGSDLTGLIGSQPGVEPWLLVQGGRTTTRNTRFMAGGQQLLRADREDGSPINAKLVERLLRIVRDAMVATSVTVLSDYDQGVLAGDTPRQLIVAARASSRRVVAEVRGADYARYTGADVLMLGHRDLARFARHALATDASVAGAAAALRDAHGFGAVLVNRAEAGMTLVDAAGAHHFRAETSEILDVSGASDTAVATLAAGLASGLTLPVAARIANIAASVVLGRTGMAVAREADLLAAISPQGAALRKIVNLEVASQRVEAWRREGWRSALTLGHFASLDQAETALLNTARAASDRLIVGLAADAAHSCLPAEAVRAARLATLVCVDLVVLTDIDSPDALLRALRPDVLVGAAAQQGAELMGSWGGQMLAVH